MNPVKVFLNVSNVYTFVTDLDVKVTSNCWKRMLIFILKSVLIFVDTINQSWDTLCDPNKWYGL